MEPICNDLSYFNILLVRLSTFECERHIEGSAIHASLKRGAHV